MGEWREHFMRLLGGVEGKVVKGAEGRKKKNDGEREIERAEVRRAI